MNAIGKKIAVYVVGWTFVVLGILGLFLPVLQGILFLLIGLTILSTEYVWAHRLLKTAKNRFPAVASKCDVASIKAKDWLHRLFPHHSGNDARAGRP